MDPRLVLTILSAAAELFALFRLIRTGAHRSYPWFAIYLLAGFVQSFVWLAGPPESRSYLTAYRWTTPVILALQCLIVLELWRKLMSCYRGIHRISHSLGIIVLLVAMAVSFSTGFDGLAMRGHSVTGLGFHWLMWGVRYTASVLCIASVILALWAAFFDHGVPENTIRHAQLLSAYFGSVAAGYLIMNLARGTAPIVGACTTGAAAACYVLWGVAMKQKGEQPIERLLTPRLGLLRDLPLAVRRWIPY